jgi:predicted MPP superfamily phosphohydrolase
VRVGFVVYFIVLAAIASASITSVIRALYPGRFDGRAAARRLRLIAGSSVMSVIALEALAFHFAPPGGGWFRVPVAIGRTGIFGFVTAALGVRVVRLIEWIAGRVHRANSPATSESRAVEPVEAPPTLTRRDVLVRAGALTVTSMSAGSVAFGGLGRARDLRVREVEVFVRDLPPTLEGLTILQLSDLHVGIFTGPRDFAAVVERARGLRPDLVVFTGDLLDNNPAHVPDAMRMFSQIDGALGRYAILGNHDYYAGHQVVIEGLHRAGIPSLVNQGIVIPSGTRHPGLALLGVDDVTAHRRFPGREPDLDRALRDVPLDAPRIVLAHNPVLFDRYAGRVALQLSGHTHGGQINPGGIAHVLMRYVSGRYERNDSVLFVSNGSGFTGPPVRLFAPPELVRIALTGRRRG